MVLKPFHPISYHPTNQMLHKMGRRWSELNWAQQPLNVSWNSLQPFFSFLFEQRNSLELGLGVGTRHGDAAVIFLLAPIDAGLPRGRKKWLDREEVAFAVSGSGAV